jgi:hypothetical protein
MKKHALYPIGQQNVICALSHPLMHFSVIVIQYSDKTHSTGPILAGPETPEIYFIRKKYN